MGRTMMIASGLPKSLWAEAANTACYLMNKRMVKPILEKNPYELLRGKKSQHHSPESIWNEDYDIGLTGDGDHKESEPQSEDGSGDHKEIDNDHEEQEEERTTMTTNQTDEAIPTEHMRPWKHQSSHPLENTIYVPNVKVQTRSSLRNLCALTTFLSQVKPKNIKEALKDLDWIIAMQDELNQFERSKVLHLLQRPKNRTVICTRWVFRNKLDEQENITRNKARLVV
ncbi:uncharacterized protein LOC142167181 [Nicotiana tabacum]|uniref:Uncharacterized protein LOC142167181 n=1 Tax=Nicotiana tabacum TaxID=4097 RepID=A0AC58SEM6_TOBAC